MMTDRLSVKPDCVQKTLFLPIRDHAVESKKRNPSLFDETAVKNIEPVDHDFSQMAQNLDQLTMNAWIKRSLICGLVVRSFLAR